MSKHRSRRYSEDYYYDRRYDRHDDHMDRGYDRHRSDDHRSQKQGHTHKKSRAPYRSVALMSLLAISLLGAGVADAKHHLERPTIHYVAARDTERPLRVTNDCPDVIYPGILTQSGVGPAESGFRLDPGSTKSQLVSADWRGRVWGRTNCTFDSSGAPPSGSGGAACQTSDCGQFVQCQGAGNPPATLAEFTLMSATSQAFYDLSLVDGYNLPMGIISLPGTNSSSNASEIPPNLTNPVCIGTASLLGPVGDTSDALFGTSASYPIPLEQTVTNKFVQA